MDKTAEDDWQRVRGIFDDALCQLPEVRSQFVREACAGDTELQTEVESLLASLESADLFLETPAVIQIAENLFTDESLFVDGQILGHYEIRELIGSGGMGEVYLARDTRLNRNVAIKVLRENLRPDHDANRRLLREARAAALLEHPNICQIYEIAETQEHPFIVMQYVVGTTLSELLAKRQLGVGDSLDLAIQIVDGLAEAHSQGIIHRDIKPANVIVNEKHQVKILDFGLAKFIEADAEAETSQRLNTSGAVMGTVPFMSPEQLRGKKVDQRSDLFSAGSLVYEMLSGKPAFHRESNAETISAILNDEPDWQLIPESLRPILQKCLAKEIDARYTSARELADDLRRARAKTAEELPAARTSRRAHPGEIITNEPTAKDYRRSHFWQSFGESSEDEASGPRADTATVRVSPNRRNSYVYAAATLGLLVLAASSIFLWQSYRAVDPDGSFDSLRPVRLVQWRSGASSNDTDYRVSHDGKMVAFSSSKPGGDEALFVKQTGEGEEIRITKDNWRNVSPIWSPNDQRIAFVSVRENEPGIYAVPSLGGNITPLLVTEKANLSLRHWSNDGGTIFYEQLGNLYRLDIATRSTERITDLPDSLAGNDRYFSLSPDETEIAYCDERDGQRDIWTAPVAGGEPRRVTNDTDEEHRPIWHPDGQRILYNVLRSDFYQINLAYRDGREPMQVTRGEGNYELIDLSPDGSRIYYTSWEKRSDISSIGVATGEELEIAAGIEIEMWPEASPDGRAIVYQTNPSPNPTANLYRSALMVRLADGRTVTAASNGYDPHWLPDSRHIAFLRWQEAERRNQLWIVNTVNGQEVQITTDGVTPSAIGLMPISRADVGEYDFSADNSRVVYVDSQKPRNVRLQNLDASPSIKLTDNAAPDVRYFSPMFSPDDQRIACVSMRKLAENPKQPEWSVTFFEDGKIKSVPLPGSIRMVGWADSGDAVIVARTTGVMDIGPSSVDLLRVSPSSGSQPIASLTDAHADTVTLSPDGKTLAFTGRRNDKDDVWIIPTTGGEARKLTNNGNTRIFYASLAWSSDGKIIYFDKQEQVNTISMFEHFR